METRICNNVRVSVSGRYTDCGDITLAEGKRGKLTLGLDKEVAMTGPKAKS